MSYLVDPNRPSRRLAKRYRGKKPLSGFEELTKGFFAKIFAPENAECAKEADGSVLGLTAQIENLDRTWNPTGFFTAAEMNKVIITTSAFASQASDSATAMFEAQALHERARPAYDQAMDAVKGELAKVEVYLAALRDASAKGVRAINAPGFKLWVLAVMKATRDAVRTVNFIVCDRTTFEKLVDRVSSALGTVIEVIKQVVGVVLQAGEAAIDVAGDLFGILAKVIKYGPYVALAGAAAFLVYKVKQRQSAS